MSHNYEINRYANAILIGLNRMKKHIYAGTVDAEEISKRRAKTKAQRVARRKGRK